MTVVDPFSLLFLNFLPSSFIPFLSQLLLLLQTIRFVGCTLHFSFLSSSSEVLGCLAWK